MTRKSIVLNSGGFHLNDLFQVVLYGGAGIPILFWATAVFFGVKIKPSVSYSIKSSLILFSINSQALKIVCDNLELSNDIDTRKLGRQTKCKIFPKINTPNSITLNPPNSYNEFKLELKWINNDKNNNDMKKIMDIILKNEEINFIYRN